MLIAQTRPKGLTLISVDGGKRSGAPSEMADRMEALERENRELRLANEILRNASASITPLEPVA